VQKHGHRRSYGDNLDVLRRHIPSESVDLVYLDPPFKSDQNYNVLFAERDGSRAAAQIKASEVEPSAWPFCSRLVVNGHYGWVR
jgi:16S rRNA G966 N2-methylase RsmD